MKGSILKDNKLEKTLFLIGFMGTGKSTVSEALAKRLGVRRIEMDQAIEEETGCSIPVIFERYGEEHFRKLETELLKKIAVGEPCIVSCGGGAAMRRENVDIMKGAGRIALLLAAPGEILSRVGDSKDRPLLNGHMNAGYIAGLMEKRREKYEEAADFPVSTDKKTIEEICDEVIKNID